MSETTRPSPEEQARLAEKRLIDEIARQRKADEAERRKVRMGCTALIVALVLLLVAGFVFF